MTKKTPEQISYNMKQVKSKGSEIEVLLQKELWRRGLRYRKNVKSIEGKYYLSDVYVNTLIAHKERLSIPPDRSHSIR